jgi:hypothetical protein
VDTYAIWVDLADSSKDLEFSENLAAYLGDLQSRGAIEGYTLERRKLGFGPDGLGEFHIRIAVRDLAQLDEAFTHAAARADPVEGKHAAVFRMVRNFRSALYRSFPDPVRSQASGTFPDIRR